MYTPFQLGYLFSRHRNTLVDGVFITRFTMFKYLRAHSLIPVQKTTAYKIETYVSFGMILQHDSWTDLSEKGRKALLDHKELTELVEEIKSDTFGGKSMSASEIKSRLKSHVFKLWARKGKLHLLPQHINEHVLNSFVSTVKSQCIFNLFDNISNKTESRHVAEWSLRSTLCYTAIVACTHFIPSVESTTYHPKKRDLNKDAVQLWNLVEKAYNKMIGNDKIVETMVPILPNLLTTTNEVTIFATAETIHQKESFYIVAKPEKESIKNDEVHSGARNNYKTKLSGDAHCRGVRIVINSTFTAGGLSAPIFVTLFGLTEDEMPTDEIICLEVPGLVAGSHQNLYSGGAGFITFVRGGDKKTNCEDSSNVMNNENDDNTPITSINVGETFSKESRVAQMYREKVYYPFIAKIRQDKYQWNGDIDNIPNHLRAVSWMDGCASQIKLITSEENMLMEKKLKITCNKHSASRTAVEQAADCGAMFKELKRLAKNTDNQHTCNNSVYDFIANALVNMESCRDDQVSKVLKLQAHKKKALLSTVSKLPIITSRAYSDAVIKKAFVLNGQLDISHKLVPSLTNLLSTYRGNIESTCLMKKDELILSMYEEAYTSGMVGESTLDMFNIPRDFTSDGDLVNRDVGIQLENRQRAKVLTSDTQIKERANHLHGLKMIQHNKSMRVFKAEDKIYEENRECEAKILWSYKKDKQEETRISNVENEGNEIPDAIHITNFGDIRDHLTYNGLSAYKHGLSKSEMLSFVQVRSKTKMRGNRISYLNVPKNRPELFEALWKLHNAETKPRQYPNKPMEPQQP